MNTSNELTAEALAVFDLMLTGCRQQNFGDYQNGDGDTIGPRMDRLHAALRAAVGPVEGLTDAQIVEVWQSMPGGPDGWLKQFGFLQFARAIEQHVEAGKRQSEVALESVGSTMANVMFNLAQKTGHTLTSDDTALLDKLRIQWDAARRSTATASAASAGAPP